MKTETFGSKFGALMVLAGSAVGLGNIWKFPYTLGSNGGAAFLLVYLLFVLLVGIPLLSTELALGRATGKNAIASFGQSKFRFFGILGIVTVTIMLCFYSSIGGWAIAYTYYYLIGSTTGLDAVGIQNLFFGLIKHPYEPLCWQFVFLFFTGICLVAGVQKGLERASKWMMPVLFIGLLALALYALQLDGAMQGIHYLFQPDFSKITPKVILAAMGQAFFSLSLGMSIMITYGAYVPKNENLLQLGIKVAISDTLVALLAGIVIFPAVFAFGLEVNSGPGLLFMTLPNVFEKWVGGHFFGAIFFLLIVFAALTSAISMLENSVAYLTTHKNYSRTKSVWGMSFFVFLGGILMSLSLGVLSDWQIMGKNLFDFFADITDKIMLAITAIGCTIYVGWCMPKGKFENELLNEGEITKTIYHRVVFFLVKYVLPLVIFVILVQGVKDFLNE